MDETELAGLVVEQLERAPGRPDVLSADRWDAVHREVEAPSTGRVADLYARSGPMESPTDSLVIEVKTSCNLTVLEQAWFWRNYAHRNAIAVPAVVGDGQSSSRARKLRTFASRVCQKFGMGMYLIKDVSVIQQAVPKRSSITRSPLLAEEQTDAVAGTDDPSDRYGELDRTIERLEDLVEDRSGIALEDAIEEINHHYKNHQSAYKSLRDAIKNGRSDQLDLSWKGGYFLHDQSRP